MKLSVVIPVFNEAETLESLYQALQKALTPLSTSWEVVFVDDGSKDNSFSILEKYVAEGSDATDEQIWYLPQLLLGMIGPSE